MPSAPATRRTILLLALCQALGLTGQSTVAITGSIVGNMLAADKALSTLPIAMLAVLWRKRPGWRAEPRYAGL